MSLEDIINGLNEKQKEAIHLIKQGKSVFITGPPGTGKSFLLDRVMKLLRNDMVIHIIAATTGCAAVNVDGMTLHSIFGIKPFTDNFKQHVGFLKARKRVLYNSLRNAEVLIIDEVSMLDNVLCDGIDMILRGIKKQDTPFGGMQMVFVGDFYQLPPVMNNYCFLSDSWKELNPTIIELNELVRQKDDSMFQKILMAIRKDRINRQKLDTLRDGREFKKYPAAFKDMSAQHGYDVELCKDAQIMVTRNINVSDGVVNGTRGIVLNISDDKEVTIMLVCGKIVTIPYVRDYLNKRMTAWIEKIAYALSIHKSQGMTLDALEIDLGSSVFENGQAYTALSRGTKLENIRIIDIDRRSFKTQ
eukprot:764955-Hanusia_phi.AAC.3